MTEGDAPKGGNVGNFLKQSTAGLPNWAWILVVGAGIAAAYFIPKFFGGSQTGQTGATSGETGLGLAVDPTTGLPYAVEGLVPSGANAGAGTTTTGTTGTTTTGTSPTTGPTFRARPKGNSTWDQTLPGIPIRSSPTVTDNVNNVVGFLPYGGQVATTGQAVQGTSNFGAAGGGNTLWYPVSGGYVSVYDLVSAQAENANFVTWPYANPNVYSGARNGR